MARATLLHLLRSQSTTFSSGNGLARVSPWACTLRTDANSTMQFSTAQRRFSSQEAALEHENKINIEPQKGNEEKSTTEIVYFGPISDTIKKVKILSLSTCCLSASLGPVVTFMTSADTNVVLKGAVASSVVILSASTTAALHWFVSPYVHKLRWQPGSDSFEVYMLSWLVRYVPKTIKFADIRPAETNRPYVSFEANGNFYFVDEEHCHDKALKAKLTPQKTSS